MQILKMNVTKLFIGLVLILTTSSAQSQLRLPNYYGDHMVLQRGEKIKLWGWAKPGQEVTLTLDQRSYRANVGTDSTWSVALPEFKAGGPWVISVNAGEEQVNFKDVYFGDVWFCSGQSNMSFRVDQARDFDKELKDADYPLIRELGVGLDTSLDPQRNIKKGIWKSAGEKTISGFSAVAWFFAKELYKKNKIPVGIIHSSWGGTPIEAFMTGENPPHKIISATKAKNLQPGLVYNAMVNPLFKFAVKGVLWYQGEANSHLPVCFEYERLLKTMIESWRRSWNKEDLPFLLVQLANYSQKNTSPGKISGWAVLQEAQHKVSDAMKNVGMVVINDLGNPTDSHPTNKQDVGKRLAAVAFHDVYGEKKMVAYGPSLKVIKSENGKLNLAFKDAGGGIVAKSGGIRLNGFSVAGDDLQYREAIAEIFDNHVIVYSPDVPKPVYVRYAFTDNPPPVNFYNKEGFPAVPFRTDNLR